MNLVPAHYAATIERYIGYYEPYATCHFALDRDRAIQREVRIAARHLVGAVRAWRTGRSQAGALKSDEPRPK